MKRFIIVAALGFMFASPAAKAADAKFVVIVNAGIKQASAPADELKALFSKKTSRWKEDVAAVPFDQPLTSAARVAFCEGVYGKSASAVQAEWRQRIFTGQATPPKEAKDDAAVIAAVAATPGAVGYVSAGTTLPPTVRALNLD